MKRMSSLRWPRGFGRRLRLYNSRGFGQSFKQSFEQDVGKDVGKDDSKDIKRNSNASIYSNQEIMVGNIQLLQNFEQRFWSSSIRYTFGYGLGVFPQTGYEKSSKKPQIDMVHVVDDATEFHSTNVQQYPEHYSFLRLFGLSAISKVQAAGAGVYYNPYVNMMDIYGNKTMVKYGIVTTDTILEDLKDWSTFYLAGRLQKPVRHIYGVDSRLKEANQYNLESAFNLSLMLLALGKKRNLTTRDLYEKIALLSYMGDPRMLVGGENPNKVKNIVGRQIEHFERLYAPSMHHALTKCYAKLDGDTLVPAKDVSNFAEIINLLPGNFRHRLAKSYRKKYQQLSGSEGACLPETEFVKSISSDTHLRRTLMTTVLGITAKPALLQSLKGILTAGVVKSAKYAWEKKMKSIVKS